MNNTFINAKRILGRVAPVMAMALLSACVVTPHNDQWVDRGEVDFAGYAEVGGAQVEIQAKNKKTNQWVTIETVVASTTPRNYGGETLYGWSASNTDTTATGDCIWGDANDPACAIGGTGVATFRVREVGGGVMTSFDAGGVNCVTSQVDSGTNWFTAGANCAGSETPIITLYTLN